MATFTFVKKSGAPAGTIRFAIDNDDYVIDDASNSTIVTSDGSEAANLALEPYLELQGTTGIFVTPPVVQPIMSVDGVPAVPGPNGTYISIALGLKGDTGAQGPPGVGVAFKGAYDAGHSYTLGDAALDTDGQWYVSLVSLNTGNTPQSDSGTHWKRIQLTYGAATPEMFGAVGDGVTDDTTHLQAWLDSGTNLALTPGKTYKHRRVLNAFVENQVINGQGGTLLRAAQAVTTTTTAITSGVTTTITVAATSGGGGAGAWSLEIGDQIAVEAGGTFDGTPKTISNIVGNDVTVSSPFTVTLGGTINVRHGWVQFFPQASNQRISNVIFDGNSANWSWGRWQHSVALQNNAGGLGADGLVVSQCNIVNQYGDAVTFASDGEMLDRCFIENIMGRGFVFAGGSGNPTNENNKITFNRFVNCNQDSAVAGSDGNSAIAFSQGGPSAIIHGNTIDGANDGIGNINEPINGMLTITGNEIYNCTGIGIGPAQTQSGGIPSTDVIVANNRLTGCNIVIGRTGISGTAGSGTSGWDIHDNIIRQGQIALLLGNQLKVHDNVILNGPLDPPLHTRVTQQPGAGTFTSGTYYYVITATTAYGESLPSAELSATVATGDRIVVSWDVVPGAKGYKVYRASTPGGETGASSLVATISSGTTTVFHDTGAAASVGAVPSVNTSMSQTIAGISLTSTNHSAVAHNLIVGGGVGILNANGSGQLGNSFESNRCFGQYAFGLQESSAASAGFNFWADNTVLATVWSGATFHGMNLGGPSVFRRNRIDVTVATVNTLNAFNLANSSNGSIIEDNTFLVGASGGAGLHNSSSNTRMRRNTFDKKPTSTSATGLVASDNKYTGAAAITSGVATLVAGTVTISGNSEILAADNIIISPASPNASTAIGALRVTANAAGSFHVTALSATATTVTGDLSSFYWRLDH